MDKDKLGTITPEQVRYIEQFLGIKIIYATSVQILLYLMCKKIDELEKEVKHLKEKNRT